MKKIVLWCITIIVLLTVNGLIVKKEYTLAHGRTVLLELAPRDPRSLMQGDYMVVRYAMAREVPQDQLGDKGHLIIAIDEYNLGSFVRVHEGEPLQEGEYLLGYRNRGGLWLGAESFMFQEGDVALYSRAQYGELKLDSSGTSVLVGLRDNDLEPLGK